MISWKRPKNTNWTGNVVRNVSGPTATPLRTIPFRLPGGQLTRIYLAQREWDQAISECLALVRYCATVQEDSSGPGRGQRQDGRGFLDENIRFAGHSFGYMKYERSHIANARVQPFDRFEILLEARLGDESGPVVSRFHPGSMDPLSALFRYRTSNPQSGAGRRTPRHVRRTAPGTCCPASNGNASCCWKRSTTPSRVRTRRWTLRKRRACLQEAICPVAHFRRGICSIRTRSVRAPREADSWEHRSEGPCLIFRVLPREEAGR